MGVYTKDPSDVLDYGFDWTNWLASGETITASTWTLSSTNITKDSDSFDDTETAIWLSAGVADEKYTIENQITTSAGRKKSRSHTIRMVT